MSQGANTQLVWGFEQSGGSAQPGLKAATMYGLRVKNFQGIPDPTTLRTNNIDPRGQRQKARNGSYSTPFSFEADMSVDAIQRLRAHMRGMATITTVAAGVQSWALRDKISTDAPATALDWISLEVDKDDSYATLFTNAALDSWSISVKNGQIVNHKIGGMACRFLNMADVAPVVGPATFTGTVYVRGNRIDSDAEDTSNDIKFKCTTAGGSGAGKVKFTKGATAYGSLEYTVTYGTVAAPAWMDVLLADGTQASGDNLNPMQVMFVGSGNLVAGGTPDEWKIVGKRTKATATYDSRNPLIGVRATVTFNSVTYDVETFDINFKRPKKYKRATGSPFPVGLLPDGNQEFDITINRDYVDRAFYLKMLSATNAAFDITINGDFIATVATVSYYEKHQFTSTNAQVIKGGANIPNDKQLPESIQIVPYWDGTNVDMSETVVGTLSSLS